MHFDSSPVASSETVGVEKGPWYQGLTRYHWFVLVVAALGWLFDTMDQQLVARIKRHSKYWGQTAPNQWFDVRVVEDRHYHLRGNSNNYRLNDVIIGVRLANGFIVDLVNGKISRG